MTMDMTRPRVNMRFWSFAKCFKKHNFSHGLVVVIHINTCSGHIIALALPQSPKFTLLCCLIGNSLQKTARKKRKRKAAYIIKSISKLRFTSYGSDSRVRIFMWLWCGVLFFHSMEIQPETHMFCLPLLWHRPSHIWVVFFLTLLTARKFQIRP